MTILTTIDLNNVADLPPVKENIGLDEMVGHRLGDKEALQLLQI